jgi:hypothetical protein
MQDGRTHPAGSSRAVRLDPFALPIRFQASDARADDCTRVIELHRERVVVRRAVRGMRMAVNLPVSAYRGVAVRMMPPDAEQDGAVAVVLEHSDASLSLPLLVASDGEDVVALWQAWARVLAVPLLVAEPDGSLREPFPRIGQVRVSTPKHRRRRHGTVRRRRPSILLRRRPGRTAREPLVHHGEREIIARN